MQETDPSKTSVIPTQEAAPRPVESGFPSPVPETASAPVSSRTTDDKFSKGRVIKYFPQSKYGFVKNRSGRDVYFNIDEIRFIGVKGRESLREGIVVGYDVSWTGHGLHVAKMKIY